MAIQEELRLIVSRLHRSDSDRYIESGAASHFHASKSLGAEREFASPKFPMTVHYTGGCECRSSVQAPVLK